ncbi:MAG: hypothetical protein VKK97_11910 [Synechococcaceae cyanobacterium]|nr:hypothetical protein [Synechococcaceae cyanobacterium]
MSRSLPWFWIALAALLLLLPGSVGRVLLDLLGGLTLTLLLLPLLAGALAWIGWQVLRARLRTCPACGVASLADAICPACGSSMQGDRSADVSASGVYEIDASQMTINVEAIEVPRSDPTPDSSTP